MSWLRTSVEKQQEPSLETYANQAAFQLGLVSNRHGIDQETAKQIILYYLNLAVKHEKEKEGIKK